MTPARRKEIGRRSFLLSAGSLAATPLLSGMTSPAFAQQMTSSSRLPASATIGRRRLGKLEVSSIGIGVQNMSRTYQTTVPTRPDMINIIRTAFDRGVTFFDAAEAYGPHEVERILGEGVRPFRNKVVITSKFGWNIDQQTGERRPGNLPHNLTLVALVKRWAERKKATPAQIALAWLMAQKPWIVPIPGTTQMPHMLQNIGADAVRFSATEIAELNASVRAIEIRGARLPEQVLVFSGVEAPPKK